MEEKNADNIPFRRSETGFAVAFNGDDSLLTELAGLLGVNSVYGKINRDVVGGGRSSFAVAEMGLSELPCLALPLTHKSYKTISFVLQ